MKILFITKDTPYVQDDIKKAVGFLEERTPLSIEYDIMVANDIQVYHTLFFQSKVDRRFWMGTHKVKEQIREIVPENEYHAVCFVYDRSKYLFHTTPNFVIASWSFWKPLYKRTEYTEVAIDKLSDSNGWTWRLIAHELMHAFVKRANRHGRTVRDHMDETVVKGKVQHYYKDADPYAKDGNYSRTIAALADHWDMVEYFPEKTKWKYFTTNEVEGLQDVLVAKLDKAREMAGVPFVITSGFRTPEQNKRVGGAKNSAHLRGLAADIACEDNGSRMKIVRAAIACGFTRIGIGDTFIHLDVDKTLPDEIIWLY